MSKKLIIICLIAIAIFILNPFPTMADDLNGEAIFTANCAGCHPKGGNIIRRGKNLKLKALKRNKVDTQAAIATLVTNGKGNMSAFGDRLTPEEIEAVSDYVLERASNNWAINN